MGFPLQETDCTVKCHSLQHASTLMSAITRGNEEEVVSFMQCLCSNFSHLMDNHGRTVLHMAASCGKWRLVQWLLKKYHCDCNIRDKESGWTPLHRCLYYGQLTVAKVLLQYGANIATLDRDYCTPLDLVMKDRPRSPSNVASGPCEAYVWGINHNYNLGLGTQQSRSYPELVDYFRKADISIKQVVLCKFHTVFLSHSGQVFTCGHGHGGRLGHSTERTVLLPQLVKAISKEVCVQVAAGTDHTVFLMQSGAVWTCGNNDFHQLGHSPPPEVLLVPKMIVFSKANKDVKVHGIRAARFHTVLWTSDGILTFGLNAGQLGYPSLGEKFQTTPRAVSSLTNTDITHVAVSDGATICSTCKGDVFVLHEYQCRKIASKRMDIMQLAAAGGNLDSKVNPAILKEKGGTELIVLILSQSGRMLLWSEGCSQFSHCWLSTSRSLTVTDAVLFTTGILFMTEDGESFIGTFSPPKVKPKKSEETSGRHASAPNKHLVTSFVNWVEKDQCFLVKTKRLAVIHRAAAVACDRKGRNFAILQMHPKISVVDVPDVSASEMAFHMKTLQQEANIFDVIHDAVLQVGKCQFVAHQYVLALQCESFYDQIVKSEKSHQCNDSLTLTVPGIHPSVMEQILEYLYTGTCVLLTDGQTFHLPSTKNANTNMRKELTSPVLIVSIIDKCKSLSESDVKQPKKHSPAQKLNKKKEQVQGSNPVKLLKEAAVKLGIRSLDKRLENVEFLDGRVHVKNKFVAGKVNFDRHKLDQLYDLVLKAEDGKELQCHKCILVARSEYFHSMLASNWIETTMSTSLALPITGDILEIVIDYLYTDVAPKVYGSDDVEFVCNVLVTADHLLIGRLKEMCEKRLTELLTLKNATELLEFSWVYNASQLKATCNQFIGLNLAPVLESKGLLMLSDQTLVELTRNYRQLIPQMCYRAVTPYSEGPTLEEMQAVAVRYPVNLEDIEESQDGVGCTTPTSDGKRNKNKRKLQVRKTSESQDSAKAGTDTNTSPCSNVSEVMSEHSQHSGVSFSKSSNADVKSLDNQIKLDSSELSDSLPSVQNSPLLQSFNSPPSTPKWLEGTEDMSEAFPDLVNESKQDAHNYCSSKASGESFRRAPKLSQKQRKKLLSKLNALPSASLPQVEQSVKSGKAWNVSLAKPVDSFKEIMESEKGSPNFVTLTRDSISSVHRGGVISCTASVEVSPPVTHYTKKVWDSNTRQQKSSMAINGTMQNKMPDCSTVEFRGPHDTTPCFSDILHSEEEQLLNLAKISSKSLHLIQIEDQAIEELLHYYQAANNPDEYITVERILPKLTAATPIWKLKKYSG